MRIDLRILLLLTATTPCAVAAQTAVEVHGEVGRTVVDAQKWLGTGVFESNPLNLEGDVQVVVGRRGPRGIQVAGEFGYQRILAYKWISGGEVVEGDISAFRAVGLVRFWLQDGSWYGEGGAGFYLFDNLDDPTFVMGAGKHFDIGDRISIPVRVRLNILFDARTMVVPIALSTGLSYRIGS